jgi:phosphatidylglycerophosphate synthase
MALATIPYFITKSVLYFEVFSILSFSYLWFSQWKFVRYFKPPGGIPNYITLVRFIGLIGLVNSIHMFTNLLSALFLLVLVLLDGADGMAARKLNQSTEFGALFDMETDSLFVCLVSCVLISKGLLDQWILIPAFIKYYYAVLTDISGIRKSPDPKTMIGATIAVLMFLALILAFVLPTKPSHLIAFIATLLICISFLYSFIRTLTKSITNH